MSETTRKDLGYPKSDLKNVQDFRILKFCGGGGGGACPAVLGATQFVYPIRVPKFVTYNRSMLFENPEFVGVEIYSDGGSDGLCDHSLDALQPFWVGFSDTGVLTDEEVKKQNITFQQLAGFEFEVQGLKLPQPVLFGGGANPNWSNRIFVHIVWNSATFLQQVAMFDGIFKVIKHDYDQKI